MATKYWLEVLPTIAFVDVYPCVLTCQYHDGVWNLIQIRFSVWGTNIPSPVSDQVFHTVVKPRTVKHMKFGYNYFRYQIVEQRSSWKSSDTIILSCVGNTDHGYILIQEYEAHSYNNRTDTKSLIQR